MNIITQLFCRWLDRFDRSWDGIIKYVIALHVIQGVLLIVDDSAGNVTSIHSFLDVTPSADLSGAIYITVALIALLKFRYKNWPIALLIPQQFVLLVGAFGAVNAVLSSQFADGVIRPWQFIAADQAGIILAAILHTLALIALFKPHLFNFICREYLKQELKRLTAHS